MKPAASTAPISPLCCLIPSLRKLIGWRRRCFRRGSVKILDFPVIGVDFSGDKELADLGSVTSLQAPHRIADAILRDSTSSDGKTLFRDMPEGRAFTEATVKDATAVYRLCPTALVFGVWDSTGPKGGMGAKFQRALTSEIVALGASAGRKVGSRIDPGWHPSQRTGLPPQR